MKYLFLLCFLSNIAFAEIVVVVNPDNSVSTLDDDTASDIFLKKQTKFENGIEAVPVNLKEGSDVRADFYDKAAQKSPAQLRAYWAKSVFTGNKQPPKEVDSSADVKQFIQSNPGGIAYINKDDVDDSLKVIMSIQ